MRGADASRRHHQVRRRDPARGQDGHPRRRPPGRRGVHRDQGARGGQDPRAARRRLRHGPRRQRHRQRPVPERQQLGARHRRVHDARSRRASSFDLLRPARRRGHRDRRRQGACSASIAEAAWECADPGIQYDDTINDWHTCSETGRITASNPCSEYLHLDDTSCNLASLNLMKFLEHGRRVRRGAVLEVGRVRHHRDGHLHLLRGLPDPEDHREHPGVPAARHRLRQPRRAADGVRPAVRLRRRPRAGRGDHRR